MRVLQMCSYYYPLPLYKNLFLALEEEGLDESIYVFLSKKHKEDEVLPNMTVSFCFNEIDRVIFQVKHRKVYDDFQEKIKGDYDVVHAHSLLSNGYIAYKNYHDKGTPYITAVRNSDLFVLPRFNPTLKPLAIKILKDAKKVIFLSPAYMDYTVNKFVGQDFRDELREKSLVIPNGIDDIFLDPPYFGEKPDLDPLRLIFVGRVTDKNKNVISLIRAADILRENMDLELVLLGGRKDDRSPYGRRVIKMIGERSYIDWKGEVSKEEVRDEMRKAHIFIMPSKLETFGLVYAEAISQGCPVVYTEGQGFDGQFQEGEVGYSIIYNDYRAIVSSVEKILNDYHEMSERGIEGAKKFSWHKIAKTYIKIYEELLNESDDCI